MVLQELPLYHVQLLKFPCVMVRREKRLWHPKRRRATRRQNRDQKFRTVSDDAGGKSLSDTSTSVGVNSTVIHTNVNIFEVSKRHKTQYFVDKVKDKRRTKNNNLEFLIG